MVARNRSAAPRDPLARIRAAAAGMADRYRELGAAPEARTLLSAAALSYVGDRFNTIALIALSFELGDGALGVGGMIALLALPRLLIQGPAGVLVDKYPGKRTLVVAQAVMGLLAAAYALLAAFPSLWLLYGLTLAMGSVRTVDVPAFERRLMALTPPPQRGTANAVHMLAFTAGELIGPLLGGLLLASLGATPLFVLNGISFLAVAAVVARLPERIAATERSEEEAHAEAKTAAGGYLALLRRGDVALFLAVTVLVCLLIPATMALFVVRAADLGLGTGAVGVFYSAMGVGTLVGGILAAGIAPTHPRGLAIAVGGAGLGALFLALFGAAPGLVVALLALALFGLTNDMGDVVAVTIFQHRLPEALYGRFFSLILMATGLGGLIGALLGPLLAERIGVGPTLLLLAVPPVAAAALFVAREGNLGGASMLEPEVVGHGMFGVPSAADLAPDGAPGGHLMEPRLRRLI